MSYTVISTLLLQLDVINSIFKKFKYNLLYICWLDRQAVAIMRRSLAETGGQRFNSRTGKTGYSVANGLHNLQHFSKAAVLSGQNDMKIKPANSLHALL